LIDWKLTFTMRSVLPVFDFFADFLVLSGVEECTGLKDFVGDELSKGLSDRIL
jgi:hypothetical protein